MVFILVRCAVNNIEYTGTMDLCKRCYFFFKFFDKINKTKYEKGEIKTNLYSYTTNQKMWSFPFVSLPQYFFSRRTIETETHESESSCSYQSAQIEWWWHMDTWAFPMNNWICYNAATYEMIRKRINEHHTWKYSDVWVF